MSKNRIQHNKPVFIFYILIGYIFLQFIWWGYHIIHLTKQLNSDQDYLYRRMIMITGEAIVFVVIIALGALYVVRSYRREIKLFNRQKNFTLSVTHELKTPIASSKLILETLKNRDLTEEKQTELLEKVLLDQERLKKLVDNIMMASKLEEDDLDLVYTDIILYEFVDKVCEEFPKTHQMINEIDKNKMISVDSFYFTSVIQNLYENAQKYSPSGTTIKWTSYDKEGKLYLSIIDEGIGIPDVEKEKVFNLFYRLEKEETRTTKGTGLGLYIVKNIIKTHLGDIYVKNNKNRGSVFTIKL